MGEVRQRLTWGDLGQLFDGPHATPRRRDEGPYFLNIASLKAGRLDLSESDHVSDEDFAKWTRRVTPQADDLLFSYETRLGEAALMPPGIRACLGRRMALIRPNRDVVDPRFLLYFYLSPDFRRVIEKNTIHGATVPRIGLATMPQWEVELPPIEEQRAIAEVLGALDDKIAANDRAVRASLDLAATLFARAVRGVAPGEHTFAQLADVGGGGTPKTSVDEYWGGDVAWATPTDVTGLSAPYLRATSRTITEDGLAACSSALYPAGSILMTSRATIGAFAIAQRPTAVNQGFIVVNAHDPTYQWWLFHEMQDRVAEFLNHANGATFLELPRGRFKALPVRLADPGVIAEFAAAVAPIHDAAAQLSIESECLAATRDALLPLLMSGKIRVKDAERAVDGVR